MQNGNNMRNDFPRSLSVNELMVLFSVLPENKPGYRSFREKLTQLKVIGRGRFGSGNLILGNADHEFDIETGSAPIFAAGTFICSDGEIDIIIHQERDNQIEVDISAGNLSNPFAASHLPDNLIKIESWSYSEWIPGEKAPHDNSQIREIVLTADKYLMAIAPVHKRIWVHENESGINYLIPVTNLYNYLMLVKNIRDIKITADQKLFFNNLSSYSDKEIISAFILYNNYFKRFNINLSAGPGITSGSPKRNKISMGKIFLQKLYKRGIV